MDELKYINSLIRHATRNLIISDYILLIETDEKNINHNLLLRIGKWFRDRCSRM